MRKCLLGHHGLRGDLAINVPAISYLVERGIGNIDMPINKKFADMAPLFLNHPHINSVFITDEYEDFPSEKDNLMMDERGYTHVGNPMQPHINDKWWASMHQTTAVLHDYTNGAEKLPDEDRQINLVKWFDIQRHEKYVAFAPFAGFASNPNNDKMLSISNAQKIVNYLVKKGYKVIQLSGPGELQLENTGGFRFSSYFDSVRDMLGCDFLIHTDTGMGWFASAYKHKQLGLYGHRYYGAENVKNIQPVNPNSLYLDAPTVAEITMESIIEAIDKISL